MYFYVSYKVSALYLLIFDTVFFPEIISNTFGLVKTTIYIIVGCVIGGIVLIIVVVVIIICCCCRKQNRGSTQGVVYQPAQGTVATPNPYQPQPMANPYPPQPMATGYPEQSYPPPSTGTYLANVSRHSLLY